MHQIIVIAIPVFVLLMAIEFAYGVFKGRNTYALKDTIGSLSQGLLSQVVALCSQLFQIGLYAMIYPYVAVFHNEAAWDAWYGWLAAVVLFDFCDYWLHRVGHESAIFWAAHVVHHQSRHFNLSTALRQESAYAFLGWMFYLPMAVVGVPPEMYGVAGLVVLVYQFWIHTEHIGKLGWFDRVLSSPSNHRVHHAVNERYIDKNFGAIFVVWDRLFGTFEPESEPCIYGTREPLTNWDPIWAVAQVYWGLLQRARHAGSWGDKARVFFKAPGWAPPASVSGTPMPQLDSSVGQQGTTAHASALARGVIGIMFIATALATCWVLWRADDFHTSAMYVMALALTVSLWAIGAIMNGRLGLWAGGLLCAAILTGLVIATL